MKNLEKYLEISDEVQQALAAGRPVVALESTIISHGMPYPQNVEMATRVEDIVRENGATPATIAIIGGRLKVGLTAEELTYLAKTGLAVTKVSRRDLPFVVAQGMDGATTVASTMIIAAMAGIELFVTGGIGGVHRGASESFDISADLQELAHTNVGVVCAGAKSILAIDLTLEYLETHGVPVVGYQSDDFPAFYTRTSGFGVDYRLDSPEVVAKALRAKWDMGLNGGVVIANPIPEAAAMSEDVINQAIQTALQEANEQGIRGKESTPFLLSRVKALTGGDSLDANIELVYHNAKVGAQIAVALAAK
ncbi:MAG: pseudouridine-5-phosphate glycosidase [Gammaproteobacteria bacterium]|nr:MAG: pseudouridine-5-phosphate glycosidase [Gammaproteobacteria bacterium]